MHLEFEVQMRASGPTRHTDGAYRVALANAKALAQARCHRLQMRIQRCMLAIVLNFDDVAVAALPTGKGNDAFGDCAHVGAGRCGVVDSAVSGVVPKNWMWAVGAKPGTNARVFKRRSQVRLLETAPIGRIKPTMLAAVGEPLG